MVFNNELGGSCTLLLQSLVWTVGSLSPSWQKSHLNWASGLMLAVVSGLLGVVPSFPSEGPACVLAAEEKVLPLLAQAAPRVEKGNRPHSPALPKPLLVSTIRLRGCLCSTSARPSEALQWGAGAHS